MPQAGCHENRGGLVVSTLMVTGWESLHGTMGSNPRLSAQAHTVAARAATIASVPYRVVIGDRSIAAPPNVPRLSCGALKKK